MWRFYEQSATIVLYLLEQGPESMLAFLQALKDNKGHDAAVAAALGIPVEGAVEEFEKRWVEWMKDRYVHDLGEDEKHEAVEAEPIAKDVLAMGSGELETVSNIDEWTAIPTDSLDMFKGVGGSIRDWKIENNRLSCKKQTSATATILGVRMDEEPPMVLRCKIKWNGSPSTDIHGQPMTESQSHRLTVRWERTGSPASRTPTATVVRTGRRTLWSG